MSYCTFDEWNAKFQNRTLFVSCPAACGIEKARKYRDSRYSLSHWSSINSSMVHNPWKFGHSTITVTWIVSEIYCTCPLDLTFSWMRIISYFFTCKSLGVLLNETCYCSWLSSMFFSIDWGLAAEIFIFPGEWCKHRIERVRDTEIIPFIVALSAEWESYLAHLWILAATGFKPPPISYIRENALAP